ncbi:MAG: tRNA pseudouridine(55) synthase TruB [Acidobacteria bacterium]|nr:tRNA pseudouridine(55) synthase TruB [Acidobacteriota bacterium]
MAGEKPERAAGLLLVDKPALLTSHDVVAAVRRALGERRVGHAGTLDPLATGLLPCAVGRATRLVRFLQSWPKTYTGCIVLGVETATGDAESAPEHVAPVPLPPPHVLAAALRRLTGTYLQQPPPYSAKKIGGIPAHRIARQGFAPRIAPVPVTVHRFRVEPRPPNRLAFAARVSSGTYIRSLAVDLGRLLGVGAYLERLRRTAIGPLRVRAAVGLPLPGRGALLDRLLSPEQIPLPLPAIVLDPAGEADFRHGRTVPIGAHPPGTVRVLTSAGALAGLARVDDSGGLRPQVVFPVRCCPGGGPVVTSADA